ncbi:cell division protein SepF (plasmid) [Pontibacillus sp. ALD_SL1]|uniref:cell division protein SepF n=1 Tax=Pontibacillus sp. ALD_SL1 TaxID=2777185 RepID=UPI001A97B966|nr:cell division protein SepF [Pontibacillus sp. ALD_SL1]QST02927.1 cell division protein SepF [Pontibacillus sp. ALD_SL1]
MLKDQLKDVKKFLGSFKEEDRPVHSEKDTEHGVTQSKDVSVSLPAKGVLPKKEKMAENDGVINKNPRLRMYKPTNFQSVENIGEDVKNGKIVLLDVNHLDGELKLKIIHFVYGLCCGLDIEPEHRIHNVISIDPKNKVK